MNYLSDTTIETLALLELYVRDDDGFRAEIESDTGTGTRYVGAASPDDIEEAAALAREHATEDPETGRDVFFDAMSGLWEDS